MLVNGVKVAVYFAFSFVLIVATAESANLIAHFPMEEQASPIVDTVSGLTAVANVGGQIYAETGPAGFGKAVGLTEGGSWNLDAAQSAALRNLVNDFTVAAWVYMDSAVGADKPPDGTGVNRIMGDNVTWDADGWSWGVYNDGRIRFTKNGIIDADTFGSYVNQDEWTHVAVAVSATDGLLYYVNGEEVEDIQNFDDINPSPGNNGRDDYWGIAWANGNNQEQWFAGLLDEVRVYSDLLTAEEIAALLVPAQGPSLAAGDADQDLDFDQLDLVRVQIAAKYLTGAAATWGEGDWNAAPGGRPGSPPAGNGRFDQLDIIAALANGLYLKGPYAAIAPGGRRGDDQTSVVYNPSTGELAVDAPAGIQLTSINIDSASAIFTGDAAQNLGGSFDNDADNNIFKATFGSSFGSLRFGNVAQKALSEQFVLSDLTVVGSLAGGGALGNVDLIYVPEPAAVVQLALGIIASLLAISRQLSADG
jgi:hypothetical protein